MFRPRNHNPASTHITAPVYDDHVRHWTIWATPTPMSTSGQ